MKIESEDIDIESLFAGRFFTIPRFQRPYSWDDDNIQAFWEDVMAADGDDYFIGSMVVFAESKQSYGVVDGQQRLTTVTVLLCALRDAFHELGEEDLALGLHQLIERKNRANQDEFTLKTETSFPFLQERILRFGPAQLADIGERQEETALREANEGLRKRIGRVLAAVDLDDSVPISNKLAEKVAALVRIRDAVLNLKLIFVKLESEDDAYLIFETLNTRGKDLSVTDLAKNLFAKLLKSNSADVDFAKITWKSVLDTIHGGVGDLDSDVYLYHFWASRHDAVPLKRLYAVMKKNINAKNARQYLLDILSDAKLYRRILDPANSWTKNEAGLASSLGALQTFRVVQPMPAVLALVRAYDSGKIKYRKLLEALSAIEKFHFSFTAVTSSRSSGGISGMYASFAKRLHESADPGSASAEIATLVSKLKVRRPKEDEFVAGFRQIAFTNSFTKQKPLVQYILRSFVRHHGYKYSVDLDELTIEHVAPQALIGTGTWTTENVGELGNLIFLEAADNELLKNLDFKAKRDLMKSKVMSVPAFVLESEGWSEDEVRSHTNEMARVAYREIWSV